LNNTCVYQLILFAAGFDLCIRIYYNVLKKINVIGCYSVLNYVIIVNIGENIKKIP
jgi:hypothetical protein